MIAGQSDLSGISGIDHAGDRHACARMRCWSCCARCRRASPAACRLPPERLFYQVETLVFGRAVERATRPERYIVGLRGSRQAAAQAFATLLGAFGCPILPMRYESAELAKIAINCCLVASVTVANTLAELSRADRRRLERDRAGAQARRRGSGEHAYLAPGLGLAGGNLERDLATITAAAEATGSRGGRHRAFVANSRHRRDWATRVLHSEVLLASRDALIGILGLAYKENTHSTKNSPSLALISTLAPWRLKVYDPVVPASAADPPAGGGRIERACGRRRVPMRSPS